MHRWGRRGWWHFSVWALFLSCFACVSGGAAAAWLRGPNDWKKMSDSGHAEPDPRQQKTCDLPPICLNPQTKWSLNQWDSALTALYVIKSVTQSALSHKNNLCSSKAEEKGVMLIQDRGVSGGSASVALQVICDVLPHWEGAVIPEVGLCLPFLLSWCHCWGPLSPVRLLASVAWSSDPSVLLSQTFSVLWCSVSSQVGFHNGHQQQH